MSSLDLTYARQTGASRTAGTREPVAWVIQILYYLVLTRESSKMNDSLRNGCKMLWRSHGVPLIITSVCPG